MSQDNSPSPAANQHLATRIDELRRGTVLCIGDIMLDRFIYGHVERISAEAPIPVISIGRESAMLGSAGNVLRNIVGLRGKAHFVAVIGDDDAGQTLEDMISEIEGIESTLIRDPSRQTSIKTRYIAGTQQLLRVDDESREPLAADLRTRVLEAVDTYLPESDVVVLSDYGKGVLKDGLASEIIERAMKLNRPVVVDPQGLDYEIYRGASVVTPNLKELSEATRMPTGTDEQIISAARAVITDHGIQAVLATRSADGLSLISRDNSVQHLAAEAQEVYDVSGAGDTVVAALSASLAAGIPIDHAIELANTAAGIVVGKVGTAVAYADDVIATLRRRDLATGGAKIMTLQPAVDQVQIWRNQGDRIGFTNGCFDLLHPGHVSVLAQAKRNCDHLIVGLNSDGSTNRLKGPERPVQHEAARAAVLASLETVDLVIIFEDDTPAKLINAIKPEIFVKGADYRVEDIPEAKIVESYGGTTLLADLEEGHSTTATIARLVK